MSLFFLIPWMFLLVYSYRFKSTFLFYFVLFQFVFVGFGLSIFPFLGFDYLKEQFSSFDFSNLAIGDFNYASVIVIIGVLSVVLFYSLIMGALFNKESHFYCVNGKTLKISKIRNIFVFLMLIFSAFICIQFAVKNYNDFLNIVLAKDISGIFFAVESRREATTNYIVVLFIYNIIPAFSLVSYLAFLERPSFLKFLVFLLYFFLSSTSLLLTYQKRPLLLFYCGIVLVSYFYKLYSRGISNEFRVDFIRIIYRLKWKIILILSVLFLFYYFYTNARFLYSYVKLVSVIFGFIFTRLIGRLSIPAAMYVNFFPNYHDFYGLSNVGLFSNILGETTFLDSKVTFSHFSLTSKSGSLAASVFIDAYGQGGVLLPIVYGFVLAVIIFIIDHFVSITISISSRAFLMVSGFIFIYYLSQASIFRSLLGYGGVFYFLVWILMFKIKFTNIRRSS